MERLPLRASARLAAICVTTLCAYFGRSRRTRIEPLSEVNAFQRPTLTTKESITAFESGSYWPSDAWIIGRCDNASYIINGGCMFPGTAGVFHVDYNEPSYKESVEFVYNSMFHLDTVMPDSVGLYVPGGYYRQPLANNSYVPLHRNCYGNRSRTKVVAKCVELYGENYTDRPDGQKNQCDEYPFSASYENATTTIAAPPRRGR